MVTLQSYRVHWGSLGAFLGALHEHLQHLLHLRFVKTFIALAASDTLRGRLSRVKSFMHELFNVTSWLQEPSVV